MSTLTLSELSKHLTKAEIVLTFSPAAKHRYYTWRYIKECLPPTKWSEQTNLLVIRLEQEVIQTQPCHRHSHLLLDAKAVHFWSFPLTTIGTSKCQPFLRSCLL